MTAVLLLIVLLLLLPEILEIAAFGVFKVFGYIAIVGIFLSVAVFALWAVSPVIHQIAVWLGPAGVDTLTPYIGLGTIVGVFLLLGESMAGWPVLRFSFRILQALAVSRTRTDRNRIQRRTA